MKKVILILLSSLFSQVVQFDYPISVINKFESVLKNDNSYQYMGDKIDLISKGSHFIYQDKIIILYTVDLGERNLYNCKLSSMSLGNSYKIFFLDKETDNYIGPLFFNNNKLEEKIVSSHFTIEVSMDINEFYNSNVIIESISKYNSESNEITKHQNSMPYVSNDRENPIILVTGFWPPTNEMIRHFSQNLELNPSGWEGDDWEGRGYDIVSFFPEFSNPDCSNCGIGYGDFEVDYQDTSNDFWPIVSDLNPIAIITFSRGYINQSWEMEYNYYNRTNWYADYQAPTLPTPNPPDESEDSFFQRNSTLPMTNIMNSVNESNLGLDAYIDWAGNPGQFVSEFMGYHGVWYRDINLESCITAGHIHVGGTIDWDTAKLATEISIRETINYLDQFNYTSGDVNEDSIIDILDLVLVVNVILGQSDLSAIQTYAADMNLDGIINIQDIILIINLILS